MNTERFTGHTPGPWQVDHNVTKKGVLGVTADAAPCIIAHGFSEEHWPGIARANAALIAAAPELLKQRDSLLSASREMVRLIPSMGWSDCIESHNHIGNTFKALTNAIALCEAENKATPNE